MLHDTITMIETAGKPWPLPGAKNSIINGNFNIWQRGTSHTTDGYGSADRWWFKLSGASGTMSRQSFSLGQTDVPGEPAYHVRCNITGADANAGLEHRIESVRSFAGQEITISFYAKADTNRTLRFQTKQNFGTGGSPSSEVITTHDDHSVTTSWQKFTSTVTLGSISGKTLGSDNNDFTSILLINPNNETSTIDVARVQLEEGDDATEFEKIFIADELERCQRYFFRDDAGIAGVGYRRMNGIADGVSIAVFPHLTFPTRMRTSPVFSISNISHFNIVRAGVGSGNILTITNSIATPTGYQLGFTHSQTFTAGDLCQLRVNNTSAYLEWSAEL